METSSFDLLKSLLSATSPEQVGSLLRHIGDSEEASIHTPLPGTSLQWVPFGNNPSNISSIGLSTKPGKSLTERITNGIDALLEERAEVKNWLDTPESPRLAAESWFGRPITGPDTGLFQALQVATDKRLSVALLSSGREDSPTIDVVDDGVGIKRSDFTSTILSLQAGNKIKRKYQIGAFGQGGSSTLGFSDFVIIATRHFRNPKEITFTVIRVLKLDQSYKEDCYAYLCQCDGQPLSVTDDTDSLEMIYATEGRPNLPNFRRGTLVRHIAFRLGSLSKSLGPAVGNLYHYLQYSLFDPLLPFRIWDFRADPSGRSEYIGGARNRLMDRALKSTSSEGSAERIQVRHYRPMEFIVPPGSELPCIGIEYWVVLAFKKGDILRSSSTELFVQPNHPVVGTLNGQTQGELGNSVLKEIGLGLLARHCIIHIDASNSDSRVRRELFATSREGFKDGPILESIVASLRRMLEEDHHLFEIENELVERLAKRETANTRNEVKAQVTRLLKESGLQVSEPGVAPVPGRTAEAVTNRPKRSPYKKKDPLPTLPFPSATFIKVVSPEQHLEIHLQDSEVVLVETDADSEYFKKGLIGLAISDNSLEIESVSPLRGGRLRWRLRPAPGVIAGATGEIRIFLNRTDGVQLADSISFEVLAEKVRPARQGKTQVPPFEILPISPEDEEQWGLLWPDDMGSHEHQTMHAYKTQQAGGMTWVYYSTVFPPFAEAVERIKNSKPELVESFEVAYEIWIAYHAIMQAEANKDDAIEIDSEIAERMRDSERAIVAKMQVKQALSYAEILKKLSINSAQAQ